MNNNELIKKLDDINNEIEVIKDYATHDNGCYNALVTIKLFDLKEKLDYICEEW